ncbi:MAG: phosphotransferase, partial [Solirubrobacteraceae bacterium]
MVAEPPADGCLVHGGFYAGNVLWRASAGRVAVIDSDEVRTDDPARELAWAAWEFCHDPDGTDLDHTAAYEFLADSSRYAPLPSGLPADLIPWVRWHLAYEIGRPLRERRRGIAIDADYLDADCRAFR